MLVTRIISTALLCLLVACSPGGGGEKAGGVAVTAADPTLDAIADTTQMTAVALDQRGEPLTDATFTWSSGNTAIAIVSASGLVTARGNGTVVITATSDRGWIGNASVQVQQVPVAVAVSPDSWSAVWIGARQQFSAATTDANGYPVAGAQVAWSTSDPATIQINANGLATAYAAGAHVLVTGMAGAAGDSVNVTVPVDVAQTPGPMYTVWFARSDSAPALIVNGEIVVPDDVIANVAYEQPESPWPHRLPGQVDVRRTVHKFQWEGDRIGLLTDMANGSGTFRAIDRVGEWTLLANGRSSQANWDESWLTVGMVNLKDGLDNYFTYTSVCSDSDLDDFTADTASQN